jgi:hypothetical protein
MNDVSVRTIDHIYARFVGQKSRDIENSFSIELGTAEDKIYGSSLGGAAWRAY